MERKYGYIESPKDLRDYRLNKVYGNIQLPESFEVKHSKIKDQGNVNSCVAFSISEILEAGKTEEYSTAWIYGYRPWTYYQGEGMIVSEALKTVNKVGYILKEDLDANIEMTEARDIVVKNINTYMERASKRQISSYARLRNSDEIKQAIYTSGKPVLLAIKVGTKGIELDEHNIAYIPDNYSGGHQMVCYGWNETGFLIQNSWSEDWGDKGTFILPYEYPVAEAWFIKQSGKVTGKSSIVKPKLNILRRFLMKFVTFFRKFR